MYDKILEIFMSNGRRVDWFILGFGITGNIADFVTKNRDVLEYWLVIAIPLILARLVPVYQGYLTARQNRKVERLTAKYDLQIKFPDHAEEIEKELDD